MTDTAPESATQVPEREITFAGRTIWVKMPRPEQILVYKRVLVRLQNPDDQEWNVETVMVTLERLRLIIDSVLVNRVDVDWLDDEMLAGRVALTDTAEIINSTVAAFADATEDSANRAERRTKAAPAKKAARKRA
jgi:hypothetical protein